MAPSDLLVCPESGEKLAPEKVWDSQLRMVALSAMASSSSTTTGGRSVNGHTWCNQSSSVMRHLLFKRTVAVGETHNAHSTSLTVGTAIA